MRNNRHTRDAPSNQPKVAGLFPQRNVGLEVNLSLSPGPAQLIIRQLERYGKVGESQIQERPVCTLL